MSRTAIILVLFLGWTRAEEPKVANPPASFVIQWNTNSPAGHSVVVKGAFREPIETALEKMFPVQVEQRDIRAAIGLPPVNGKYKRTPEGIEFRPQFPFQPGVRYRATFQPNVGKAVSSVLELPVQKREAKTVVTRIYPTADVLPENLLKFYLYFSAPMSGGQIYEHIHLTDERGKAVELPFLEIDEELWNPEMTRLTLFLDPGRIKRGVKPLEEIGSALQAGKRYTLRIDSSWLDATGTPLKESFVKEFRVAEVDRDAPDLAKWELTEPKAGTKDPLRIRFSDPMDHALVLRMMAVEGVAGVARLEDHERLWVFVPEAPWKAGPHRLRVQTTIEDLAGNNIGKPFEVDLFEGVEKRLTRDVVERSFEVK
jgi:hypothetical protein